MALQNSGATRELAISGPDFASIDIRNKYVTHSRCRCESQITHRTERSLLLPMQIGNNSLDEGTIAGATVLICICQF